MQNTNAASDLRAVEAYKSKKVKIAVGGLIIAWISSVTTVMQGTFNGATTGIISSSIESTAVISIIISITILALNDILAGIWSLIYCVVTGRSMTEVKRMMNVKASWMMLLAAVAAGPFATGCWMSSVSFCGITYTTTCMSFAPIIVAIMGRIIFKENLNARIYLGIIIVIGGIVLSGWSKPEGMTDLFYLGIALAMLAPIGFTAEGMLSTYAADLIDPITGCAFYRCLCSGIVGLIAIFIIAAGFGDVWVVVEVIKMIFSTPILLFYLIIMGLLAAVAYGTTYVALNKCGPTRTIAIVNTMPVWSIPVGYLFAAIGLGEYAVSGMGILGACIVVVGVTLVVAKPSELFSLRDQD